MPTKRLVAAATVGALLCAPALWAQTGDTGEVSQQTASAQQIGQAAGQALDILELDSGPPVTYADVLRNPDDIQLNLRFARAQVNEGNVRGAAATLERILLIEPAHCDDAEFRALAERHTVMFGAYRGQRWAEARTLITECRRLDGEISGLYDLYDERIAEYQADPPDADWDGVFIATTK